MMKVFFQQFKSYNIKTLFKNQSEREFDVLVLVTYNIFIKEEDQMKLSHGKHIIDIVNHREC